MGRWRGQHGAQRAHRAGQHGQRARHEPLDPALILVPEHKVLAQAIEDDDRRAVERRLRPAPRTRAGPLRPGACRRRARARVAELDARGQEAAAEREEGDEVRRGDQQDPANQLQAAGGLPRAAHRPSTALCVLPFNQSIVQIWHVWFYRFTFTLITYTPFTSHTAARLASTHRRAGAATHTLSK